MNEILAELYYVAVRILPVLWWFTLVRLLVTRARIDAIRAQLAALEAED